MAGQCGHGVGVRGGGRTVCMAHTRVCCAVRVWLCWGGCTLGFCSKGLMSVCVCVCGCAEVVARWDFAARGLCLFVRACVRACVGVYVRASVLSTTSMLQQSIDKRVGVTRNITYAACGGEGPELGAVVTQLQNEAVARTTRSFFSFDARRASAPRGMWGAAMSRLDPPYT